ncbi:hypothetical protein ALC53_00632 [Atta colombica]|uniref:Uncharacterized protein n=1 Tax=Atta colombica TaxID=520822 RepID=A0A195BWN6_9HYME|nr:hypothetical protein ALC53_00632 [Atta colombica]
MRGRYGEKPAPDSHFVFSPDANRQIGLYATSSIRVLGYRWDDVNGFGFRYFPLSSRVSSLVNGNLSLTPHGRSEAGVNGEVQNRRNSPMRCLSAGNFQAAHVLEPVRSQSEDLDVASFRLLHLKYASPLSSMLQFNFGRPAIGGGHCKPPSFNLLRATVYHPPIPFRWERSRRLITTKTPRVPTIRTVGLILSVLPSPIPCKQASLYVGNNLRHAEVLALVFGSPVVISFIKFLTTRVGKFLPKKESPSNQQSQIAGGREVIRRTHGMVPHAAFHSGPIKFQQLPVQAGLPPRGENRLVLQSNGAHSLAQDASVDNNPLLPDKLRAFITNDSRLTMSPPAEFNSVGPDGASTNGTIARQPRSEKEQGTVKGAVGRDWEARKRSLGCGRGGGKRGGEGGRQRNEGDAGCMRVVPCGIGRSQNARQEIEHVYNVSIKCHVHKLCSTRHHMLFRIFLNNQYSDNSLPFYSKKLFKEKLLVNLADNDPDAYVHLTFLRSYQRRVGRGWFIEGGPYAEVSDFRDKKMIIFGVRLLERASKHFDGSSMKSTAALLFVDGVISQRLHGMSRQEKSLHGRCPKISKFVMEQFCPAGILCCQKVSQERNRLSKQEVDLPAIVALPLMPASRTREKRINIDLVTLGSTTLQLELFWV